MGLSDYIQICRLVLDIDRLYENMLGLGVWGPY